MESKKTLRKTILDKRAALSQKDRISYSERIYTQLVNMPEIQSATVIASFMDFKDEVETGRFNEWCLKQGKKLALPRIDPIHKTMSLHYVQDLSELVTSNYGIKEPDPVRHSIVDTGHIQVVVTPGVGFDSKGYRLGYGGGYYDRLFSCLSESIPRIAIAFELQMTDSIPVSPHDHPVTHLITETGIRTY